MKNIKYLGLELAVLLLTGSTAFSAVHEVTISSSLKFEPSVIEITEGDTVIFKNPTTRPHTVTADPALVKKPDSIHLPEGAEPFHSGMIDPGKTFEKTFTVVGHYKYTCLPHELMGMQGEVNVKPKGNPNLSSFHKYECNISFFLDNAHTEFKTVILNLDPVTNLNNINLVMGDFDVLLSDLPQPGKPSGLQARLTSKFDPSKTISIVSSQEPTKQLMQYVSFGDKGLFNTVCTRQD